MKNIIRLAFMAAFALYSSNVRSQVSTRDVLLVANSGSGTVSLIDGMTFQNLGTIDVIPDLKERMKEISESPAHRIAYALIKNEARLKKNEPADGFRYVDDVFVSPDGTRLYVSRDQLGDVVAFDLTKAKFPILWRSAVDGFKADHAALSPDGSRLAVSASLASQVQILDTRDGHLIDSFKAGILPHQNEYSFNGDRIYNGSLGHLDLPFALNPLKGARQLTVVNAKTLDVVRVYQFHSGLRPMVITDDESTLYAQLSYLNGLIKFDLTRGTIIKTLQEPLSSYAKSTYANEDEYPHNSAHHGLAISGDGMHLCDAGTIDNTVSIVSTDNLDVEATFDVGPLPYWATSSRDGRFCFVSVSGDRAISVIDYNTKQQIARIPVDTLPQRSRLGRVLETTLQHMDQHLL